jgi:succinate dehydrogenase / fumarate reductase cytochrome b subunit
MEEKNNPLSPHLQIYKWQISSLLSIAHRIVGVINILAITIICFWSLSLLLGARKLLNNKKFFSKFFWKICSCWTLLDF